MESRRRCGLHARRLREGLLRCADRGRAGLAVPRPRLPDPGASPRPGTRSTALVAAFHRHARDSVLEESRREPALARALGSIYGPEPAWEPRVVSWATD